MRLYVTGYYQGEYMYMLTKDGLIMSHKEYSVAKIKHRVNAELINGQVKCIVEEDEDEEL